MGRKAGSPPSPLWTRLVEALKEQGLPTTQRGIARMAGRSHGAVWLWYHGESLPELATVRRMAMKGKVTTDWILTGRQPKYPIAKDPVLSKILEVAIELDDGGRKEVLRIARKWQIQKRQGAQ